MVLYYIIFFKIYNCSVLNAFQWDLTMKKGMTVQEHETRYDPRLISRGETERRGAR